VLNILVDGRDQAGARLRCFRDLVVAPPVRI
jgi:hypothetical protein